MNSAATPYDNQPSLRDIRFIESMIKMPVMELHVRSTIVKVGNSEILISPGSKVPVASYAKDAPITDLVASNLFHAAGIPKASSVYPAANIWGVEGSAKNKPDIKFTHVFGKDAWPYEKELSALLIEGSPKWNEVVFVHHASKSLIVTDLAFNPTHASGLGARIVMGIFGTYRRFAISRLILLLIKQKSSFEGSIKKIFEHDFDNIIVSHGANIYGGGKEKLRQALVERGFRV